MLFHLIFGVNSCDCAKLRSLFCALEIQKIRLTEKYSSFLTCNYIKHYSLPDCYKKCQKSVTVLEYCKKILEIFPQKIAKNRKI